MSKRLAALCLSLLLCGGAAAAIIATNAVAQAPNMPVQLVQAAPPAPNRGPAPRIQANRPQPTAAERAARRNAMCQDGYARAAGRFAELEVRLDLTATQQPVFARWRDARLAAAKARAGECAARPLPQMGPRGAGATPPSPVERLTREETMLQHRLADIQAERPALEALYASLNPTQRQVLARERGMGRGGMRRFGMGGPGMGRMGGNMMFRRGGPGMMGRGPQGPGRIDPGIIQGPGMMPPPPPPAQ